MSDYEGAIYYDGSFGVTTAWRERNTYGGILGLLAHDSMPVDPPSHSRPVRSFVGPGGTICVWGREGWGLHMLLFSTEKVTKAVHGSEFLKKGVWRDSRPRHFAWDWFGIFIPLGIGG